MTDLHPLRASLDALDRLMELDGRITVLSFPEERRPERMAPREPAPLPAVLVERITRLSEVHR